MNPNNYPIAEPNATVIVEYTSNGIILTTFDTLTDNPHDYHIHREVIELPDREEEQAYWEGIKRMLWEVLDAMGIYTSKQHKFGIDITVTENAEV